jgi:hypothetical protein
MPDKNPTRARHADNKKAFVDVLGDPFAPEPIEGHYNLLKRRSSIGAMKTNFDEGQATDNPARPNALDFFCDVERVVKEVIQDRNILNKFETIYMIGEIEKPELSQAERNRLEQRLGKLFKAYRISPVSKYFISIRRPSPEDLRGKKS